MFPKRTLISWTLPTEFEEGSKLLSTTDSFVKTFEFESAKLVNLSDPSTVSKSLEELTGDGVVTLQFDDYSIELAGDWKNGVLKKQACIRVKSTTCSLFTAVLNCDIDTETSAFSNVVVHKRSGDSLTRTKLERAVAQSKSFAAESGTRCLCNGLVFRGQFKYTMSDMASVPQWLALALIAVNDPVFVSGVLDSFWSLKFLFAEAKPTALLASLKDECESAPLLLRLVKSHVSTSDRFTGEMIVLGEVDQWKVSCLSAGFGCFGEFSLDESSETPLPDGDCRVICTKERGVSVVFIGKASKGKLLKAVDAKLTSTGCSSILPTSAFA